MSLKTDYFDSVNGIHSKMNEAFVAGSEYVDANLGALSSGLVANAAQGKTKFTIIIPGTGTANAAWLRGNKGDNLLLKSFFAGIVSGLSAQEIYSYECTLELDVSSTVDTNVKFNFNFQA